MDQYFLAIFQIIILIFSAVIHEFSHGAIANALGDPTAKYAGRLTLNPLKHLDFWGSFVIPLLTYSFGGFIFGWAKPVPYNPYNLRSQRWGAAMVGAAGPASNLILALVFGFALQFLPLAFLGNLVYFLAAIVYINLLLAVFNLMPIPPLDGSKLLFAILPDSLNHIKILLEQYAIFFVFLFIFFIFRLISPLIGLLFQLVTSHSVFYYFGP